MGANQSAEMANAVDEAEQVEAAKVRMLSVAKLRSAFQCPGYGGLGQASIFFWYFELRTAQESQELSRFAYLGISKEALQVDHCWHVSRLACACQWPTDVACLSRSFSTLGMLLSCPVRLALHRHCAKHAHSPLCPSCTHSHASLPVCLHACLQNATAAGAAGGIRLFKYILAGDSGRWETLSSNAQPRFYDVNQDTGAKHAEWHLEIEAGDIDVCCNDNDLAYEFAVREKRITFSSGGSIFALKYPSQDAAQAFTEALRDKCFYNEHKFDIHDEDKAKKALGADGGFLTMVCVHACKEWKSVHARRVHVLSKLDIGANIISTCKHALALVQTCPHTL